MNEQWSQIGLHRYRRMDTTFEWAPCGTVELGHARALVAQLEEHLAQCGELAVLTNGSKLLPLAPEVRSYYVHASRHSLSEILIVIYGATPVTRATQLLVIRATPVPSARLLGTGSPVREFRRSNDWRGDCQAASSRSCCSTSWLGSRRENGLSHAL